MNVGTLSIVLKRPAVRLPLAVLVVAAATVTWAGSEVRFSLLAAVVMALTWLECGRLRPLGFGRPRSWLATLVGSAVLASIAIVLVVFTVAPLVDWLLPAWLRAAPDISLAGELPLHVTLSGLALLLAAVTEEIIYRGYLLHQLDALFGGSETAQVVAVLVGALIFAVPHVSQGVDGVIGIYLTGALFGWVFFRTGRNLPLLMLAHALLDAWSLVCRSWYGGLPSPAVLVQLS